MSPPTYGLASDHPTQSRVQLVSSAAVARPLIACRGIPFESCGEFNKDITVKKKAFNHLNSQGTPTTVIIVRAKEEIEQLATRS